MKRLICVLTILTVITSASLFADWMFYMEHYNVYEVKMSNFMELYIDINGNLLYQKWDD